MRKIFVPVICCILLIACTKKPNEAPKTYQVNPNILNLAGHEGSVDSFSVNSSEGWTATINSGANWFSLSANSGATGVTTVKATTTQPNVTGSSRTATITIAWPNSNATPVTVTVNQASTNPVLMVDRSIMDISGAISEKDSFQISSNIDWSITTSHSWLTLSQTTGSKDAKIYVINADDNLTDNNRTGTITISPVGISGVQPKTITVNQKSSYRPYGGNGYDVIMGSHHIYSVYIFTGATASSDNDLSMQHGLLDMWLIKTDENGKKIWQKAYGGDLDDVSESVAPASGGYVMVGYTESNNEDVSGNHGKRDIWIVKVDENGNKIWQKTFGGTDNETAHSVVPTNDGGVAVTGTAYSNDGDFSGSAGKNLFVLKLDASGNKQWLKTFGGSNSEDGYAIEQLPGGYYIAGATSSTDGDISGHPGVGYYSWVLRLDASGTLLWQRVIPNQLGTVAKFAYNLSDDGSVFLAGSVTKSTMTSDGLQNDKDFWICKVKADGTVGWQKTFGGGNIDEAKVLVRSSANEFVCAGSTWSSDGDISGYQAREDIWLLKIDLNGNKISQKTIGGTQNESCTTLFPVPQTNNLLIGASTNSGKFNISGTDFRDDGLILKVKM